MAYEMIGDLKGFLHRILFFVIEMKLVAQGPDADAEYFGGFSPILIFSCKSF